MIGSESGEILPSALWSFYTKALYYYLSCKYSEDKSLENQPWALIPSDERQWISLGDLEKSIFGKKKNIIMLDFDEYNPVLTNGRVCLEKITTLKSNNNLRNIYMIDSNMNFFLFYIEDGGLLIEGNPNFISKIFGLNRPENKEVGVKLKSLAGLARLF
jgi:hypothetical protein